MTRKAVMDVIKRTHRIAKDESGFVVLNQEGEIVDLAETKEAALESARRNNRLTAAGVFFEGVVRDALTDAVMRFRLNRSELAELLEAIAGVANAQEKGEES